ncbi:hypothetical protein GW17_00052766 [Ensete ventricosum]|nr:hypothetical protein GW17_00052766 [Ensete ventricosum]
MRAPESPSNSRGFGADGERKGERRTSGWCGEKGVEMLAAQRRLRNGSGFGRGNANASRRSLPTARTSISVRWHSIHRLFLAIMMINGGSVWFDGPFYAGGRVCATVRWGVCGHYRRLRR